MDEIKKKITLEEVIDTDMFKCNLHGILASPNLILRSVTSPSENRFLKACRNVYAFSELYKKALEKKLNKSKYPANIRNLIIAKGNAALRKTIDEINRQHESERKKEIDEKGTEETMPEKDI